MESEKDKTDLSQEGKPSTIRQVKELLSVENNHF